MYRFFPYLFLFLFCAVSARGQTGGDFYERGLQAEQSGDVDAALDLWLQGRGSGEPDPRIGIAFIRAVTEHGREDYYEFGSLMYGWGLSGEGWSDGIAEAVDEELQRIRPLSEEAEYREMRRLLRAGDTAVFSAIAAFWKKRDPTPITGYNERLLEHWERIAHIREHYTRNRKSVYGTDERGEIYIRYGKPDVVKQGILQFNSARAGAWVVDIIASSSMIYDPLGIDPEPFVREAEQFHTNAEYDIWVYHSLRTDQNRSTIFLFGSDANTGQYGQVQTVEDFIPRKAMSMGSASATGRLVVDTSSPSSRLRAGLILQLMYYDQLATADAFFGTMLQRIESRVLDRGEISLSLMQEMQQTAWSDLVESETRSPQEESVYEKAMLDIPLQVYQYRLVDDEGDPYLATFLHSRPQQAFWYDYLRNYTDGSADSADVMARREQLSHYRLVHGMQAYDRQDRELGQARHDPDIATGSAGASVSLLTLPHVAEGVRQVFSAELHNRDETTDYPVETLFPSHLRGLGKVTVEQPALLPDYEAPFSMGDLILGHDLREPSGPDDLFPFTVAHEHRIPQGKELVLHFEVYNLPSGPDGISRFALDYQVSPVRNLLSWTRRQEEDLTLTLNLETDERTYRENLQIRTVDLSPGDYEVRLVARNPQTGGETVREFRFEVVEQE